MTSFGKMVHRLTGISQLAISQISLFPTNGLTAKSLPIKWLLGVPVIRIWRAGLTSGEGRRYVMDFMLRDDHRNSGGIIMIRLRRHRRGIDLTMTSIQPTTRVKKLPEWSSTFTHGFVGGEISVWWLAALIRKTHSPLEFISCSVGISCRSFLTKRIFHSLDFAMSSSEHRANIQFCVLLEKSPEMLKMVKKAYGSDSSNR
ncbi:HTH_48 domain-containing protein [Trichonephila clavipes]|nr:HTH_48 domain-containing protein [Trichonephila clavipes]